MPILTENNAADILTPKTWAAIASYMNDDIREEVHMNLAPCTEYEFLTRYIQLDTTFPDLLAQEFSIII